MLPFCCDHRGKKLDRPADLIALVEILRWRLGQFRQLFFQNRRCGLLSLDRDFEPDRTEPALCIAAQHVAHIVPVRQIPSNEP